MNHFEIEIKCLIVTKEKADNLINKLGSKGYTLKGTNMQLNHYFIDGNIQNLYTAVKYALSSVAVKKLEDIIKEGSDFSVRTRQLEQNVLLVVKSSVNNTSSENGTARIEFEEPVKDLSLNQLDEVLLSSDFQYQAKWSRHRREYRKGDITITIDRNAGYGYLAEFETLVQDEADIDAAYKSLLKIMDEFNVSELSQDRLGRMFAYYNENWREYYGTNKVFTIE